MTEHPSQYALDGAALGGPVPAALTAHLARCARCASAVAARRRAEPPPAWLERVRVAPPRRRRRRLRWLLPIPALAVLAIAVPLALRHGEGSRPALRETREKGAPVVTVYVKRGEAVAAWDGRAPVRPGDRLRVGVRGAGYAHLSVASLSGAGGEPALLYAGPLAPTGETLLPLAFRVDARGRAEVLSVIAAARPVAISAHAEPPERVREGGAWTVRLSIAKEVP